MKSEWSKPESAKSHQELIRLFPIRLTSLRNIERWKAVDAERGSDVAQNTRGPDIPDSSS